MQPRIVCAANKTKDNQIVLGIRHYDSFMHRALAAKTDSESRECEQGFVDQFGTFYSRIAAFMLAYDNKQIVRNNEGKEITPDQYKQCFDNRKANELFSENLY